MTTARERKGHAEPAAVVHVSAPACSAARSTCLKADETSGKRVCRRQLFHGGMARPSGPLGVSKIVELRRTFDVHFDTLPPSQGWLLPASVRPEVGYVPENQRIDS